MKKYLIVLIGMFISILPFYNTEVFVETSNESLEFLGERTVVCTLDISDLNNYIDGGRSAFELIIRQKRPEWLNFNVSSSGRDVAVTISFNFNSYDDYIEKVTTLLVYRPSIIYEVGDKLTYVENFNPIELYNFMENEIQAASSINDIKIENFFKIKSCDFIINGNSYKTTKRINIRDNNKVIFADNISISTIGKSDGSYERTIVIKIDNSSENSEDVEKLKKQFENFLDDVSVQEISNDVYVEGKFEAENIRSLVSKTMLSTNISTNIIEEEIYVNKNTVGVNYKETFDFTGILKNKDSNFVYRFDLPDYCSNLSSNNPVNNKLKIKDLSVNYSGPYSDISLYYERGFKFTKVEVLTDFSHTFEKVKRKIMFVAPSGMASKYHDVIKDKLTKIMPRGTVLNIYDNEAYRYYELYYASYFVSDIENFTSKIMQNDSYSFEFSRWSFPFEKNEIKDKFNFDNVLKSMVPINNIEVTYKFPNHAKYYSSLKGSDDNIIYQVEGNSININANGKSNINFKCRYLNLAYMYFYLFFLLIFILMVRYIRIQVKKYGSIKNVFLSVPKNLINAIRRVKVNSEEITIYSDVYNYDKNITDICMCDKCHTVYKKHIVFCEKCGCKIKHRKMR